MRAYAGRQFAIFMMVFGMTRLRGELTTYRARGGHATDWANPTRFPKKEPSNTIIIIHIVLCVSSYNREWLPAAIFSVYKQRVRIARMRRAIIVR